MLRESGLNFTTADTMERGGAEAQSSQRGQA